ncbi:Nitrogen permease regulator 3 [Niveomyces insectorum RCEF 264]|uniref:Nitrogen permease regulator 3 n=1 Tax=Niveomyces insectorum RCEF 264 TaxID=1081102 RepID=A0A167M008_9HYPO|nr:Nitrogen permease regulator 3 [Niveomyces insectorum RCEF 264]
MTLPLVLPNPSNFLGVALVVNRNRDGPRFVYHYPSRIFPPQGSQQQEFNVDRLDDDDGFSGNAGTAFTLGGSRDYMPNPGELARWNRDDHLVADNGTHFVPWEYVAGLPTKALEGILTPPRAFHRKRFQISLGPVFYVSYPIHVPTSGFWSSEKNQKRNARNSRPMAGRGHASEDKPPRNNNEAGDKEDKVSSMTMFNLVFILSPKRHEAKELLDVMYTHVIREVNKVYKYCQESSDFVWQECKKIIQLKDEAREKKMKMSVLWENILATSSLAASMRDVYEAICRNKIAVLELSLGKGSVGHSVQIPMPFYVSDVQPRDVETPRSLWLTTANAVSRYDALGGLAAFDKCFALLLTDDDDTNIIAELQARGDKAAAAMIDLVKASKPTLSFHQIAQLPDTMLTIQQVRAYAQHFIYWRRAMAVPPIHARDVYVLSPNCDVGNLARATVSFTQTFPFAPPLPDLLAGLSAAPRPYKSVCPSKSLRPAYLNILAWLIRGGWVCQLCTFAYVVVWPEIQYEVEYNLEAEDIARTKRKLEQNRNKNSHARLASTSDGDPWQQYVPQQLSEEKTDTDDNDDDDDEDDAEDSESSQVPADSQGGRPTRPSAAERAAEKARRKRIAEKAARALAERETAHARTPAPLRTEHPSVNDAPHLAGMLPHVILDASKPTGRESLYLSAIERHLRARRAVPPPASKKDGDPSTANAAMAPGVRKDHGDKTTAWNDRVAEMWPVFWKYLNGRSALEHIALLEEMKRKDVWNLLSAMSEYLLCVRHW